MSDTSRFASAVAALWIACGCYASHGETAARVEGITVEHAWMDGDFGPLRDVSGAAYELDVIDRRPDGQAWMSLHMHSGARGGDLHPWAMIGLGLRQLSFSEADMPPGVTLRQSDEPGVELWVCSGPGHAIQEFEANATAVELRVLEGAEAAEREIVFEAEIEGGDRVRGGFTLRR